MGGREQGGAVQEREEVRGRVEVRRLPIEEWRPFSAGGVASRNGRRGGGRGDRPDPSHRRDWPLIPAILLTVLIGILFSLLGMFTQILANIARAQLPGA